MTIERIKEVSINNKARRLQLDMIAYVVNKISTTLMSAKNISAQ